MESGDDGDKHHQNPHTLHIKKKFLEFQSPFSGCLTYTLLSPSSASNFFPHHPLIQDQLMMSGFIIALFLPLRKDPFHGLHHQGSLNGGDLIKVP